MADMIDPKQFGIPKTTRIEKLDEKSLAILIDRKSRIIMADGRKVLDKSEKILSVLPQATIILKTSAPVCSKTIQFLKEKGILVEPLTSLHR